MGRKIAFISNRGGNTSLGWRRFGRGAAELVAREKRYLKPMARLSLKVFGPAGKLVAARVFVHGGNGRLMRLTMHGAGG